MISGTNEDESVTVTLDNDHRVYRVEARLDDRLRVPAALVEQVGIAYGRAISQQVTSERPPSRPRRPGEVPRAVVPVLRPVPRLTHPVEVGRIGFDYDLGGFVAALSDDAPRHDVGSSSNDAVRVRLRLSDQFGDLAVDGPWLLQSDGAAVGRAVSEAFEDAYFRRDH